ncbi:MAG TPA: hypothetical protein VF701_02390 [Thermoanaerobaculia bacterium]
MKHVHPIVFLAIVALMLSACGSTNQTLSNPCSDGVGKGDRKGRIVCIDDTGTGSLKTHPEPVEVWERTRKWFGSPVKIDWYTVSGTGSVQIDVQPATCVTVTNRAAPGHAFARTRAVPSGKSEETCKYTVTIPDSAFPPFDPDIVIIRCCTSQ